MPKLRLEILMLITIILVTSPKVSEGCGSTLGVFSNVICVSKSQFRLPFHDPIIDTPLDCPIGTVCADIPEICSAQQKPICQDGSEEEDEELCMKNPNPDITHPVCVSESQFALCIGRKISQWLTYSCEEPTPYCNIVYNEDTGSTVNLCSTIKPTT